MIDVLLSAGIFLAASDDYPIGGPVPCSPNAIVFDYCIVDPDFDYPQWPGPDYIPPIVAVPAPPVAPEVPPVVQLPEAPASPDVEAPEPDAADPRCGAVCADEAPAVDQPPAGVPAPAAGAGTPSQTAAFLDWARSIIRDFFFSLFRI